MNITVNGTEETIDNGSTLADFITAKKLKVDQVVVAVNDDVIERDVYEATKLNEGDILDVMSFVGGG